MIGEDINKTSKKHDGISQEQSSTGASINNNVRDRQSAIKSVYKRFQQSEELEREHANSTKTGEKKLDSSLETFDSETDGLLGDMDEMMIDDEDQFIGQSNDKHLEKDCPKIHPNSEENQQKSIQQSEASNNLSQKSSFISGFIKASKEAKTPNTTTNTAAPIKLIKEHSDKIDYILIDVPDRFKTNTDKGFLSILHSSTQLSREQLQALRVPLDYDGWDLFDRAFLGNTDVTKTQKKDNVSLDPSTFESLEDIFKDNEVYDDDDPFGLSSIQKSILEHMDEKEPAVKYPDGAWWIDEMKSRGWLNDDDDTNELNLDFDIEEDEKMALEQNKNMLNDLLTNLHFYDDKEDADMNDDPGTTGKDWDERLWAAARTHYHKALPEGQEYVAPFRSLLEICLQAYINVFHNKLDNSAFDQDLIDLLQIPEHLPLSLFVGFIEVVVKKIVEQMELANDENVSHAFQEAVEKSDTESLKYALISALVDVDFSLVLRYQVGIVDMHENFRERSDAITEQEKNHEDSEQVQNGRVPKRFMKKLLTSNYNDQIAVERFLYGEDFFLLHSNDDETLHKEEKSCIESEKVAITKMHDDAEEIRLNSNLIEHFESTNSISKFGSECIEDFLLVMLARIGVDLTKSKDASDGPKCFVPSFESEPRFSVIFALQYLIRFILFREVMNHNTKEKLITKEVFKFDLILVYDLLLDSNLLHRRISSLGALLSVKECLNEWQIFRALHRKESGSDVSEKSNDDKLFSDTSDLQMCSSLFNHLLTTLGTVLTEVTEKGDVWTEKEKDCLGRKALHLDKIFDETQAIKLPKKLRLHMSICCIDVGRCCYNLGIEFGKSVKINNCLLDKEEVLNEIELNAYDLAMKAFRKSSKLLSIDKSTSAKIHGLNVSNDLYLADSLVARAYCYDTKLFDYEKAVSCYKEALSRYRHLGDHHMAVGDLLQNLGSVYFSMKKFVEALKCYKKRLSVIQHHKNKCESSAGSVSQFFLMREEAYVTKSIAKISCEHREVNNAIINYEKAVACFKKLCGEEYCMAECLSELAGLYLSQYEKTESLMNTNALRSKDNCGTAGVEKTNSLMSTMLELDRKAYECLQESITLRRKILIQFEGVVLHKEQEKNLVVDLTKVAIIQFRRENHDQALMNFIEAWNLLLVGEVDSNVVDDENFSLMPMEKSQIKTLASEYVMTVKLLLYMGNLWTRLESYENALYCYDIAHQICAMTIAEQKRHLEGGNDAYGTQLDLAYVIGNKGFVMFTIAKDQDSARRQLQNCLKLLDATINDCDSKNFDEINFSASIEKLKLNVAQDFSCQVFIRLLLAKFLNLLGRVYNMDEKHQQDSISCYEQSMSILDGIVEDCQGESQLVPSSIKGSSLDCTISLNTLFGTLADSYQRSGKLYLRCDLVEDGMFAYERAISILEDQPLIYIRDDEMSHGFFSPKKRDNHLLNSYLSMLKVYQKANTETANDLAEKCNFSEEDLQFRIGNHYTRAKKFSSALDRYEAALQLTEQKLATRNHGIVANIIHNIAIVQKQMMISDKNHGSEAEGNLKEAIDIAMRKDVSYLSLASESMIELANLVIEREKWNPNNTSFPRKNEVEMLLREALDIRTKMYGDNDINVAKVHAAIGKAYFYQNQNNEAKLYLNKANLIFSGSNQFGRETCENLFLLGQVMIKHADDESEQHHQRFENLDKASDCFQDCFRNISETFSDQQILQNTQIIELKVDCLLELIAIHGRKRSYIQALQTIIELLTMVQDWHKLNKDINSSFRKGLQQHFRHQIGIALFQLGHIMEKQCKPGDEYILKSNIVLSVTLKEDEHTQKKGIKSSTIAQFKMAQFFFNNQEYSKSMPILMKYNDSNEGYPEKKRPEIVAIKFLLGAHFANYDFDRSLKCFHDALNSINESKIPSKICYGIKAVIHHNCAKVRYKLEDIEDALIHAQEAKFFLEKFDEEWLESVFISGEQRYDYLTIVLFGQNWDLIQLENIVLILNCFVHNESEYFHLQNVVAKMVHRVGIISQRTGKMEEAFRCWLSTLKFNRIIQGNDVSSLMKGLQAIGELYYKFNQNEKSFACYELCYAIWSALSCISHKDSTNISSVVLILGDLAHRLGQIEEAEKWLKIVLNLTSNTDDTDMQINILILKSKLMLDRGDYKNSLNSLDTMKRAVQKEAFTAQKQKYLGNILHFYGRVFYKNANLKKSLKSYQECLQLRKNVDPHRCAEVKKDIADVLIAIGKHDEARSFICDALKMQTSNYASDHSLVAASLLDLGGFLIENIESYRAHEDLIRNILQEATRVCRFNSAFNELAKCLFMFGKLEEKRSATNALNKYTAALNIVEDKKIQSDLALRLLYKIGRVYHKQHDSFEAVKYFKRALILVQKLKSSNNAELVANIYFDLGMAEFQTGQIESSLSNISIASQTFVETAEDSPMYVLCLLGMAKIHAKRNEENELVQKLIKSKSHWKTMKKGEIYSDSEVCLLFGDVYNTLCNFDTATKYYQQAFMVRSQKHFDNSLLSIQIQLCIAHLRGQNLEISRKHAEKGIEMCVEHSDRDLKFFHSMFIEILGDIEFMGGSVSNALAQYEEAIHMYAANKGKHSRLLLKIGACHVSEKRFKESLKYFQDAMTNTGGFGNECLNTLLEAKQGIAYSLFMTNEKEMAMQHYSELLNAADYLDPCEKAYTHVMITILHFEQNRPVDALRHFEEATYFYDLLHDEPSTALPQKHRLLISNESLTGKFLEVYESRFFMINTKDSDSRRTLNYAYAIFLTKSGDFKTAVTVYENMLNEEILQNENQLLFANVLQNLAHCHSILGDTDTSLARCELSMTTFIQIYGDADPCIAEIMLQMADTYATNSKFVDAIALGQRSLNITSKTLGTKNKRVGFILERLGHIFLQSGELDASSKALSDGIEILQTYFCKEDENLSSIFLHMGDVNYELGLYEKSLEYYKHVSPSSKMICNAMFNIAEIFKIRGEMDKAERCFKKCFHLVETELDVATGYVIYGHDDCISVDSKISTQLELMKDLIRQKVAGCQNFRNFTQILGIYGKLFAVADMDKEALFCFDKCLELYHPKSVYVGDLLYERGCVHKKLGNMAMAVESLRDAVQIFRLSLQSDSRNDRLCQSLKALGECQSTLGRVEDALSTLVEVETWLKKQRQQKPLTIMSDEVKAVTLQIGRLNQNKMEYRSALENFATCMKLSRTMKTESSVGDSAYALGVLYFESGHFFRAVLNYQHAIDMYNFGRNVDDMMANPDTLKVTFGMGELFVALGRYRDALKCFKFCFEVGNNNVSINQNSDSRKYLTKIGLVYMRTGDFKQATNVFHQAIELCYKSETNGMDFKHSWMNLADSYKELKDYENALFCYHATLENHNALCSDDDSFLGDLLHKIGFCHLINGNYDEATKSLTASISLKLACCNIIDKETAELFDLRFQLGLAFYYLGDRKKAIAYWEEVMESNSKELLKGVNNAFLVEESLRAFINTDQGNTLLKANALEKCGVIQAMQGKYEDAIGSHKAALVLFQQLNGSDDVNVANALYNTAVCMNTIGASKESSKLLQKALKIIRSSMGSNSLDCVDVLHQLGVSCSLSSDYSKAVIHLEEAIQVLKVHKQHETLKAADINKLLGEIEFDEDLDPSKAEFHLTECLRLKSSHGKFSDLSPLLMRLSRIKNNLGQSQKMINIYESCLLQMKVYVACNNETISMLYLNLGILYESGNNTEKALICYEKSSEFRLKGDSNIRIEALVRMATLLMCCERDVEAKDTLEMVYKETEYKDTAQVLMLEGQLLERSNKVHEAIEYYNKALSVESNHDDEIVIRCKADLANLLLGLQLHENAKQHVDDAIGRSDGIVKAKLFLIRGQILQTKQKDNDALKYFDNAISLLLAHNKKVSSNYFQAKSYRLLLAKAKYLKGSVQASIEDVKALKSFNDCLAIIRKIGRNDYFLKALTMRKMGEIYAKRHEHKNALECFQEAIKVYSNQETGYNLDIAYILLDVAFIFYHQGKYEKVLLCCSANISVFERGKDEMEITAILGKCLGLKAIAHDELNDSDVAMEFYDKSIEAFRAYLSKSAQGTSKEKLQEKSIFLASSCARKARLHERLNQDSMAIKQYSYAIRVYNSIFGSKQNLFVADILERLANIRGRQRKFDKAFVLMETTLEIRMNILGPSHVKVSQALYGLGVLFDRNKEYDAAIHSLSDCLEIQGRISGPTSLQYAETLAALGQSIGNQGDLKNAVEVWNEAIIIYEMNGYSLDNEKIVALEKQLKKAEKILKSSA